MLLKVQVFSRVCIKLVMAVFLIACDSNNKDIPVINLTIENHSFIPNEVIIPENTKVNLIVHNKDLTIEEFECPSLRKEKIIPGGSNVSIIIAPQKKGVYDFFGEFHANQAKGKIIVN